MTPELNAILVDLLKSSKAFVVSEAPEVVRQYLAMEAFSYLTYAAVGLMLFILGVVGVYWGGKENKDKYLHNNGNKAVAFGLGIFGIGIGFVMLLCGGHDYYTVTHFPQAYLMSNLLHK